MGFFLGFQASGLKNNFEQAGLALVKATKPGGSLLQRGNGGKQRFDAQVAAGDERDAGGVLARRMRKSLAGESGASPRIAGQARRWERHCRRGLPCRPSRRCPRRAGRGWCCRRTPAQRRRRGLPVCSRIWEAASASAGVEGLGGAEAARKFQAGVIHVEAKSGRRPPGAPPAKPAGRSCPRPRRRRYRPAQSA